MRRSSPECEVKSGSRDVYVIALCTSQPRNVRGANSVGTVYRRENELSITKRKVAGKEREKPVFDSWNYQHYFWFVSMKGEKNISVYCKL